MTSGLWHWNPKEEWPGNHDSSYPQCPKHMAAMDMVCLTCHDLTICKLCEVTQHKDHDVKTLYTPEPLTNYPYNQKQSNGGKKQSVTKETEESPTEHQKNVSDRINIFNRFSKDKNRSSFRFLKSKKSKEKPSKKSKSTGDQSDTGSPSSTEKSPQFPPEYNHINSNGHNLSPDQPDHLDNKENRYPEEHIMTSQSRTGDNNPTVMLIKAQMMETNDLMQQNKAKLLETKGKLLQQGHDIKTQTDFLTKAYVKQVETCEYTSSKKLLGHQHHLQQLLEECYAQLQIGDSTQLLPEVPNIPPTKVMDFKPGPVVLMKHLQRNFGALAYCTSTSSLSNEPESPEVINQPNGPPVSTKTMQLPQVQNESVVVLHEKKIKLPTNKVTFHPSTKEPVESHILPIHNNQELCENPAFRQTSMETNQHKTHYGYLASNSPETVTKKSPSTEWSTSTLASQDIPEITVGNSNTSFHGSEDDDDVFYKETTPNRNRLEVKKKNRRPDSSEFILAGDGDTLYERYTDAVLENVDQGEKTEIDSTDTPSPEPTDHSDTSSSAPNDPLAIPSPTPTDRLYDDVYEPQVYPVQESMNHTPRMSTMDMGHTSIDETSTILNGHDTTMSSRPTENYDTTYSSQDKHRNVAIKTNSKPAMHTAIVDQLYRPYEEVPVQQKIETDQHYYPQQSQTRSPVDITVHQPNSTHDAFEPGYSSPEFIQHPEPLPIEQPSPKNTPKSTSQDVYAAVIKKNKSPNLKPKQNTQNFNETDIDGDDWIHQTRYLGPVHEMESQEPPSQQILPVLTKAQKSVLERKAKKLVMLKEFLVKRDVEKRIKSLFPFSDKIMIWCLRNLKFTSIDKTSGKREMIDMKSDSNIIDVYKSPLDNTMWFCCWDGTIWNIDEHGHSQQRMAADQSVRALCVTHEGTIVLAMDKRIKMYNLRGKELFCRGRKEMQLEEKTWKITDCGLRRRLAICDKYIVSILDYNLCFMFKIDRGKLVKFANGKSNATGYIPKGEFESWGLCFNGDGDLLICDTKNKCILKFDENGEYLTTVRQGDLFPQCINRLENQLYVAYTESPPLMNSRRPSKKSLSKMMNAEMSLLPDLAWHIQIFQE